MKKVKWIQGETDRRISFRAPVPLFWRDRREQNFRQLAANNDRDS